MKKFMLLMMLMLASISGYADTEMGDTRLKFGMTNEAEMYYSTDLNITGANLHLNNPGASANSRLRLTNSTGLAEVYTSGDGLYLSAPGQSTRFYLRGTAAYFAGTLVPNVTETIDIGTSSLKFRTLNLSASLNAWNIYAPNYYASADMFMRPNDNFIVNLDNDNNTTNSQFIIRNGAGNNVLTMTEQGNLTLSRNDAGTTGETNIYMQGQGSQLFRLNTLSSNLQIQDQQGEIVRFNYTGTRFNKDLKPLNNWDNASFANLGSPTEIWKTAYIYNVLTNGEIQSNDNLVLRIDADNNSTNSLLVKNGAGSTVFSIAETGAVSADTMNVGTLTTQGILPITSGGHSIGSTTHQYLNGYLVNTHSNSVNAAIVVNTPQISGLSAGDLLIESKQNVNIRIDSDQATTAGTNTFNVKNGSNNDVFSVNESGRVVGNLLVSAGKHTMTAASGTVQIDVSNVSTIITTDWHDITDDETIYITQFDNPTEGQILTIISSGGQVSPVRRVIVAEMHFSKLNGNWDTIADTNCVKTLTLKYINGEWYELSRR